MFAGCERGSLIRFLRSWTWRSGRHKRCPQGGRHRHPPVTLNTRAQLLRRLPLRPSLQSKHPRRRTSWFSRATPPPPPKCFRRNGLSRRSASRRPCIRSHRRRGAIRWWARCSRMSSGSIPRLAASNGLPTASTSPPDLRSATRSAPARRRSAPRDAPYRYRSRRTACGSRHRSRLGRYQSATALERRRRYPQTRRELSARSEDETLDRTLRRVERRGDLCV